MIHLSFDEFRKLSRRGNLIALRAEVPSDLETPVSAFLKLEAKEPCAFLLESAEQEERIGRYSFLGFAPAAILFSRGRRVFLKQKNRTVLLKGQRDLLEAMRRTLSAYRLANPVGLPSFAGGFVGFLGYENVRLFEQINLREKNGLQLEDGIFFLVKDFLLFDHFRKTLSLIALCEVNEREGAALKRSYEEGKRKIERLEVRLRRALSPKSRQKSSSRKIVGLRSNIQRKEFERRLRRIKEYIRAGDCI